MSSSDSKLRKKAREIREQKIGSQFKGVLLVEGTDDVDTLHILLTRFLPAWEQRWVTAPAGKKDDVLGLLRIEPTWLGLVDRDEWSKIEIDRYTAEHPNLMILPRYCMESYLIHPNELWQAIPLERQSAVTGGQSEFDRRIHDGLPQYLRHGVLFTVVTPLWSGLRALGFKESLASEESVTTAQNDAEIRRILHEWDELLNPDQIFENFRTMLTEAQSAPVSEQLSLWVHGKVFWKRVVNPLMNELFGQMGEDDRRREILRRLPQPADLAPILDRLKRE